MKKGFLITALILFTSLIMAQKPITVKSTSQDAKTDVILKVNGDELMGTVTEVGDSIIKFVYQGEQLSYSLKKSDILKITFASGRIEFFNKPPLPSEQGQPVLKSSGLEEHHNKVAVLPFQFLKNNQDSGTEMSYKVQNDVYAYLNKHSSGLTFIDPRTTNALLAKKNITKDNLMTVTMDEICGILGVEYVVIGTVTQNKAAQTSTTSGNVSADTQNKGNKDKTTISGYNTTASYEYYSTNVAFSIYNDKNDNIYNQSRRALINSTDGSYDSPLEYLLKRCPLYRK